MRVSGSDRVPLVLRFSLIKGRVGRLGIKYRVETQEQAVVKLSSRVFGHANDEINIDEKVIVAGKFSGDEVKIRVALEDHAKAEVTGKTAGNAEGARGHVKCLEIVKDPSSSPRNPCC